MSYVLTDFVNCETVQDELNEAFGCDRTKMLKPNETSLVQFLFSPMNTSGTLQKQMNDSGKLKDVKLVYTPRIPLGAVTTTIDPTDCASTNDGGQRSTTYTLDENVGVQIDRRVNTEDLIRHCKANGQFVNELIQQMIDAAIRKMDQLLAAQVIALSGGFGQNEANVTSQLKTVRTRKTASGATMYDVSTNFIEEISFAAENAGYCGNPVVMGFNEIYKAFKAIDASNCCSDAGINIAQLESLAGTTFIPNRNISTVFNDSSTSNKFITLDPGAAQVITYNRYLTEDGVMTVDLGTSQTTVVVDPRYGIPFDLRVNYSCGVWSFFISLAFKTVGVPTDVYEDEDIYDGTTGINKYIISNT